METNQNPVQEQPAQTITQPEQFAEPAAVEAAESAATQPEPQADLSERLYDPAEAKQIARLLTDHVFDPEYILLFGKLVGGTPHSDVTAYDLLMVVNNMPRYDWMQAKRFLRYKMPYFRRKVTYINLYILPLSYVHANLTPFLYFARSEGELLYCSDRYRFLRPGQRANFAKAYSDALFHFETFHTLGCDLLEQAGNAYTESGNMRLAAQFTAQALVYFYHTLYYVYHGMEFDSHDPVIMHDRMRTLSAELMLTFDDSRLDYIRTLPRMRKVSMKTSYNAEFHIDPHELEKHMECVEQAAKIIEGLCELRLECYEALSGQ